ncbi:hypothetical protein QQS21_003607, partial [Conoideocrella luteorostrata]
TLLFYVGLDAANIALIELENQWGWAENNYNVVDKAPERDTDLQIRQIRVRLADVSGLFQRLGDILLLLCLVELGNGCLYCLVQLRATLQKYVRYGAVGLGIVFFALTLAVLGVSSAQHSKLYDNKAAQVSNFNYTSNQWYLTGPYFDVSAYENGIKISVKLQIAYDFIIFVTGLAIVAYASYVLYAVRSQPHLKSSATLFLVATIFMLVHFVWVIALGIAYFIPDYSALLPHSISSVADPILGYWTYLVALLLVFVVGLRKKKGLWSKRQPQGGLDVSQQQMQQSEGYMQQPQYIPSHHELNSGHNWPPPPLHEQRPHELSGPLRSPPPTELEQSKAVHELK